MIIKKTVGVDGSDGKDYEIYAEEGGLETVYHCKRVGQRFECLGVVDSIKGLKKRILSGHFSDRQSDVEGADRAAAHDVAIGTWDCINPCALLVKMVETVPAFDGISEDDLMLTLDNYGWLDENGRPDFHQANREFERFRKLTGET